jgi:hypothetical protein
MQNLEQENNAERQAREHHTKPGTREYAERQAHEHHAKPGTREYAEF